MLSRKIELYADDMAVAIEKAKSLHLEIIIDKLSCTDPCTGRILYECSPKGIKALAKLVTEIFALEIARLQKPIAGRKQLNLHLLKSKKQRT